METPKYDRPLVNIDKSGTYILTLCRPKTDEAIAKRFKWSFPDAYNGGKVYATCNLFFLAGDGLCLSQDFSVKYWTDKDTGVSKPTMALAMLVGKFSGAYAKAPSEDMSVEQLFKFVEPAFGKKATVEVEVSMKLDKDKKPKFYLGKPQYKYRFKSIVPFTPLGYSPPTDANGGDLPPRDDIPEAIDF